jgi:hypothetical protein
MHRLRKNIGKVFNLQYLQKNQIPGYNLHKYVNDLYKENYKPLKK